MKLIFILICGLVIGFTTGIIYNLKHEKDLQAKLRVQDVYLRDAYFNEIGEGAVFLKALQKIEVGQNDTAKAIMTIGVLNIITFLPDYQKLANISMLEDTNANEFAKSCLDYFENHRSELNIQAPPVHMAISGMGAIFTNKFEQKRLLEFSNSLTAYGQKTHP